MKGRLGKTSLSYNHFLFWEQLPQNPFVMLSLVYRKSEGIPMWIVKSHTFELINANNFSTFVNSATSHDDEWGERSMVNYSPLIFMRETFLKHFSGSLLMETFFHAFSSNSIAILTPNTGEKDTDGIDIFRNRSYCGIGSCRGAHRD